MRMLFRAGLLAATMLCPAVAFAQAVPPAPDDDTTEVADIVVTARKTAERLQDVPVAITAFDAAEIRSARITNLADVAKLTPGLIYTPLFGRQNQLPIIRGAAQTFGQLNVGVFLDGIYLSGKGGVDLELNDLQRIEVVKGPQSALYGRNTFAGAINYVTQRPSAVLSGRAEATGGTNGLYRGQASISGPLSDTLRFRVGGFYRHFDGFYRSSIDGGKVDFEQSYGGLGTLEWQPDDRFTATLRVSYSNDDSGQPASSVIRTNAGLGTPAGGSATQQRNLLYIGQLPSIPINGVSVNTGTFTGLPGGDYGDREEAIRSSVALDYDFGTFTGSSITSYAKRNAEYTYDGDNTICDRTGGCPNFGFGAPGVPAIPVGSSAFALSSNDGYLRDVSQELRFASNKGGKIDWLFGLFYYDNITSGADRGVTPVATSGATAYTAFNPNYAYPRTRLTTRSYSAFGSLTWHATEQFSVTGELRYEYEKQTFTQCPTYVSNPAPVFTPPLTTAQTAARDIYLASLACGAAPSPIATSATTPFAASSAIFDLAQDFRFVTPRVILNYKVTPDVLVYASYARGEKTGGFNTGLNVFVDQRAYQPEDSNNYEIGLKSDLLDRRLRLNLAGFYIDWNNQQAACQNPASAGGSSTNRTYTCNVAASTIYGVEAEAVARVAPWFSISANYAWTHARYDAFIDDSLQQALVLAGLPAATFNGKFLPYVPEHKVGVTPRFTVPLGIGSSIEARADLQYQSRTYLRADNLQSFAPKTNVDLRITANLQNLSLQLFANNVLDNRSSVAAVRFFDSSNYSVSAPLVTGANRRELGATIGYRF